MGGRVIPVSGTTGNELFTSSNPGSFELTGSKVEDVTFLSAVTATGAGTAKAIGTNKMLRLEVWGTGTFSIEIKVNQINGSGAYYVIQPVNLTNLSPVTSITAAGIYDIDVSGFSNVIANVTAISGGNVNAVGKWVA